MLILLPPSEGKSEPTVGRTLDLQSLCYADQLTPKRNEALGLVKEIGPTDSAQSVMDIYTGVLYQALGWSDLSSAARKRGENSIHIISAAYGVLTPRDFITPYKSTFKSGHWREPLSAIFEGRNDGLVIDCRSSTYMGAWTPPIANSVHVRVFSEIAGERKVITHMSKKFRGELVRYLLSAPKAPTTITGVLEIADNHFPAELTPATDHAPHYLDIIIKS